MFVALEMDSRLNRSQPMVANTDESDNSNHTVIKTSSSVFPTASWEQKE